MSKTRILATGRLRAATRVRVDHETTPEEAVTIVTRPSGVVRITAVGPSLIEVENPTTKDAFVLVVASSVRSTDNVHRAGVLDIVAGAVGADVVILKDIKEKS